MSNVVLNTNVHIVAVQPTPQTVVVVQPTQQTVVVDTSKIGPPGPAGTGIVNTSTQYTWSNVQTFSENIILESGLSANGSYGSAGHVLHSNGSATYWAVDDTSSGTVSSVTTGNGLSGGPITTTGTISILANTGVVANSTGLFVNSAYIEAFASNAYSNAVSTAASDASSKAATAYSNAIAYSGNAALAYSNAVSYVDNKFFVNTSQLSSNLGNYALLAGDTFTGKVTFGNSSVNTSINAGAISTNTITLRANGYIDFNTTTYKPSWQTGRLYYDNEEKTWVGFGDGSEFEISLGQREWVRCRNSSGSIIYKGQPVYITGVHIPGDPIHGHHPTIALADASDVVKKDVLGLAGENIAVGAHGYVVVRGYIEGLDTSALTAGQRIHLGFSAPGVLQTVAPEYPNWPMDVGVCLTSNSTVGTIYVNINDHSVERFRVAQDAVIGGDLRVDGELRIFGNVISTSAVNLSVDSNLIYLGSGDTIANTIFTGSGLNDMLFHGVYEGATTKTFYVKIDSAGATDTFAWSIDNFATTVASGIAITGAKQTLSDGITVQFQATTGHTLNNKWSGTAAPVDVDLGIVGNYNNGTYRHAGFFRDASDGYWKVFDNYAPEPSASINIDTSNNTFHLANFQANSLALGNTSVNWITANATALALANTVGIYANGSYGSAGQVLSTNGTVSYWENVATGSIGAIQFSNGAGGLDAINDLYYAYSSGGQNLYLYNDQTSSEASHVQVRADNSSGFVFVDKVSTTDTLKQSSMAISASTTAGPALEFTSIDQSTSAQGFVFVTIPQTSTNYTYTLTLPNSAGSNGQVLTTDGSGNLSWSNNPVSNGAFGRIQLSNGAGGFLGDDNYILSDLSPSWGSGREIYLYSNTYAADGSWINDRAIPSQASVELVTYSSTDLLSETYAALYSTAFQSPSLYFYAVDQTNFNGEIYIKMPLTTSNPSNTYSYTLTLPDSAGSNGQVLTTDGSGNLSWTAGAATAYSNAVSYVDGKSYVNTSQLSSNLSNYALLSGATFTGNLVIGAAADIIINAAAGIYANGTFGTNGQILTSNGSAVYWSTSSGSSSANTASYLVSPIKTVSTNYSVLADDSIILTNTTSSLTITLPAASLLTGKSYEFKNINTGTITLVGSGSDTIDGYSNLVIQYKNSMLGVRSLGSSWMVY